MKHKKKGRKFGRVRNQRKALLKSLLDSLIMHEKITTTEAKAKEIKNLADKVINRVKRVKDASEKAATIRDLRGQMPAPALKKLSGSFLERFSGRNSGYTRVTKLVPRKSDSARTAFIEFV